MEEIATRRERVVLELEDNFTTGMARAAAAAATLNKTLDGLSGSSVRSTGIDKAARDVDKVGASARRASPDIDRFSGRLGLLRDAALTIGPAFIPIGAVAVPAVTALAAQMGAAALAGGTMVVAFQGMGDALKAVNEAALEPTADNLEAARIAMGNISPQARDLVRQIQDLRPAFTALRDAAGAGLFPGVESALNDMVTVLPNVERLLTAIGTAAGDVTAEFGEGLAGPRGQEFLDFLSAEMPSAIADLGHTVANLAAGMGELWMAFTPLNRDVSGWLADAARGFDDWASGLSQTQGFQDFVAYVRENGPRVADAMGAIGNALVQVVQAAAPLGGPVLGALEAVANVIAAIANSAAGPALFAAATGLALLSRSLKTIEAVKASTLFSALSTSADGAAKSMTGLQRATAIAGGALAGLFVIDALQGGLDDYTIGVEAMTRSILEMNDAASSDLPSNLDGLANSIDRLANPNSAEALQDKISGVLGGIGNEEEFDRAKAQIEAIESALLGLVQEGKAAEAEDWLRGLNLSDSQMADFLALMPNYTDALVGIENQARATGDAATAAGRRAAQGFGDATSAAERFKGAIASVNRLLEGRASMRDYEAALDDFTKSVRQNGRSLDINTNRGRENEAALDAIASSALKVAETMQGSNKTEFLRQARRDIVDASAKLKGGESNVQQLLAKLREADAAKAEPKITVDASGAQAQISSVESWLNSIQDELVYVNVERRYRGVQKYATGGYISGPGTGTSDSIPAWLSNGEFVLTAAAVQRYGVDFLHQLNAMRFAQGGLVSQSQMQPSRPSVSVAAPSVSVGGSDITVVVDGVRHIARAEAQGVYRAEAKFDQRMRDRD